MSKLPTLESRIASALTATDITSSDLAQLLIEVEAAAAAADADAAKAREQALDPATVVDVDKVAAAVASATLTHDRLQAALPRLQDQLKRMRQAEAAAAWRADAAELEERRVSSGTEFRSFYGGMIERIVDHLYAMQALDKEISSLNSRRPDPSIPALDYITPFFALDLKIPDPDNAGGPLLWPPPQPTLAQQMAPEMMENPRLFNPPGPGPEWWKTIEERDRQRRKESERLSAFCEAREREAEKRREAELREAREAHRRQHGW